MRKRECLKGGKIVDARECGGEQNEIERCGYFPCPGDFHSHVKAKQGIQSVPHQSTALTTYPSFQLTAPGMPGARGRAAP